MKNKRVLSNLSLASQRTRIGIPKPMYRNMGFDLSETSISRHTGPNTFNVISQMLSGDDAGVMEIRKVTFLHDANCEGRDLDGGENHWDAWRVTRMLLHVLPRDILTSFT